jgi:hypothetical protein
MKKLFIVMAHYDCEGDDPVVAFESEAMADEYCEKLENMNRDERVKMGIHNSDCFFVSPVDFVEATNAK